jgi:hypothetical protein
MLALAVLPATALADDVLNPGPYSESSQLSTDAYSALGLTVSDDTGAAGTYAPYGNDKNVSTTLLSDDEVYMAANGARSNAYTLRGKLNQLYDANTGAEGLVGYTTISDDYGGMGGANLFWPINELYGTSGNPGTAVDMVEKGVSYYSPLSDNENDVIKGSTNNGFSGKYATSVSADLGSGYKDHVVEMRAYGSQYYTMVGNRQLSGAFAVKVFSLAPEGNRTEVASLAPRSTKARSRRAITLMSWHTSGPATCRSTMPTLKRPPRMWMATAWMRSSATRAATRTRTASALPVSICETCSPTALGATPRNGWTAARRPTMSQNRNFTRSATAKITPPTECSS